jgi:hypothetical protein
VVKIQRFFAPVTFQVLGTHDGVDVVLGMNFLSSQNSFIVSKSRSISIPMCDGTCLVVEPAPQAGAFAEYSSDSLEIASGARLARLIAHEDCNVLLGYVKELSPANRTSAAATAPSESQPVEVAQFGQDLLKDHTLQEVFDGAEGLVQ